MNMAPQLDGGLSLGLSGFQFWSQDIGGFLGDTNDKLLIRWMQLGVFLSHTRIHGFGNRELYKFAPETVDICRRYIQLRYRLLPYIYGNARNCVEKSLPMAKPLMVEYQDDPNVWNISDEYLFGDDMLIAPIFNEKNKRSVYLPKGTWTYWWTQERITGGYWVEVEADLDIIPVYIREGAIIPMGPVMNYVDEVVVDKIDVIICKFENDGSSSFLIPVNDAFINIEYTNKNGNHIVKTDECDIAINILYW